MDDLRVDADQAYNASRAVGNDAQELREEFAGCNRIGTTCPASGPVSLRPPMRRSGPNG